MALSDAWVNPPDIHVFVVYSRMDDLGSMIVQKGPQGKVARGAEIVW